MSATARPITAPTITSGLREPPAQRVAAPSVRALHASAARERGGTALFRIEFVSQMTDSDLHRLARTLDLVTHMHPKMHPDPTSLGVARLDHGSGLFLERGSGVGRWMLEARTWGHPAPRSVREWYLIAAGAAHQLDPSVPVRAHTPAGALNASAVHAGRMVADRNNGLLRRVGV
jgi:hypothetical protein